MIILDQALAQRAADGNPVRIGIVGAGYMARGIAAHADAIVGMQLVAISNRTSSRAEELFRELGHDVREQCAYRRGGGDADRRRHAGRRRPIRWRSVVRRAST